MKKTLLSTLILASSLFAEQNFDKIVPIHETEQGDLESFMEGMSDKIIMVPKNSTFPISVYLKGDTFETDQNDSEMILTVKKTLYAKKIENKLLFSFDLKTWKPFEVLFTGELNAQLSKHDSNGYKATIGMTGNERVCNKCQKSE